MQTKISTMSKAFYKSNALKKDCSVKTFKHFGLARTLLQFKWMNSTMVSVSTGQPSLNQEFLCTWKNFKMSLYTAHCTKWKNAKKRPILYEK